MKYIHAFLDWDNVGTFGLEKMYERLESNDGYVPDIFFNGNNATRYSDEW